MKLASSSAERDLYESLAEIYSIILTLDGLEKAYIKDVVTEAEYTETCARLLKQYKSSLGDETVARDFVDLETFKRTWGARCLAGLRSSMLIISATARKPPRNRASSYRTPRNSRAGLAYRSSSQQVFRCSRTGRRSVRYPDSDSNGKLHHFP